MPTPATARITFNVGGDKAALRRVTYQGRPHIVVPAASMEEAVLNGSNGPVFYPADEIAKGVPTWNGRAVVVYHPTDDEGLPTSACKPHVLEARSIGTIFNSSFDTKLRHEVWIDEERCKAVDNRVLDKVGGGEPVEVSTGVLCDNEVKEGEYKNVKYGKVARNHRGDHLAVLPDKLGAYSIADGGGLLIANEGRARDIPEGVMAVLTRGLAAAGKAVGADLTAHELSFSDVQCQICEQLAAKYGEPGKYWPGYVIDVYPAYAVYCDGDGCYMIGYTVADDVVSLSGDATPVTPKRVYQTDAGEYVGNEQRDTLTFHERETPMAKTKKELIDTLISRGAAVEEDRGVYEAHTNAQLERLIEKLGADPTPTGNQGGDPPAHAPTPTLTPPPEKKPTLADLIDNADPDVKNHFRQLREHTAAEKKRIVEGLMANGRNTFTKEFLEKKTLEELQGIQALAAPEESDDVGMFQRGTDYSGAAGGSPVVANEAAKVPTLGLPKYTYNSLLEKAQQD